LQGGLALRHPLDRREFIQDRACPIPTPGLPRCILR
jgi:hypothetical protein